MRSRTDVTQCSSGWRRHRCTVNSCPFGVISCLSAASSNEVAVTRCVRIVAVPNAPSPGTCAPLHRTCRSSINVVRPSVLSIASCRRATRPSGGTMRASNVADRPSVHRSAPWRTRARRIASRRPSDGRTLPSIVASLPSIVETWPSVADSLTSIVESLPSRGTSPPRRRSIWPSLDASRPLNRAVPMSVLARPP